MPSRINPELDPKHPEDAGNVDISKRYDVYCSEGHYGRVVVYRNVRFLRIRQLLGRGDLGYPSEVMELEQPNGQSFFLARYAIIRFCEHGTEVAVEVHATAATTK